MCIINNLNNPKKTQCHHARKVSKRQKPYSSFLAWNANNGIWGYLAKEGYGGQCLGSISCYSYGIDKVYIFLDFRSFIGDFAYHFWKLRPFKRRWCIANFTPNITKTAEEYSVDSKCFWIAYISFITICPTIIDNNNACLRSSFQSVVSKHGPKFSATFGHLNL